MNHSEGAGLVKGIALYIRLLTVDQGFAVLSLGQAIAAVWLGRQRSLIA